MHLSNAREEIIETLVHIPNIIIEAEYAVETFPQDPALDDKAEKLYLAVLTALQGAVEWFAKNPIGELQTSRSQWTLT